MDFVQLPCEAFSEKLASKDPVPGGGGASALAGALGAALGHMVGALTLGKKKYADVEEEIVLLMQKAETIRRDLEKLIQEDADCFAPLAEAYRAKDPDVLEAALHRACEAPLAIMQKTCSAIDLLQRFAEIGSKIALSDAGAGAALCRGALNAAALNIFINTKAMTDRVFAEQSNEQADRMLEHAKKADDIYQSVLARLR